MTFAIKRRNLPFRRLENRRQRFAIIFFHPKGYPPNLNHQKDSLQLLEKLEAGKTFNNVRVLSKYFSTPADSPKFDQNSKMVFFKNAENSVPYLPRVMSLEKGSALFTPYSYLVLREKINFIRNTRNS